MAELSPIFIKAGKGEIAEKVVVAGDSERTKMLAKLLERPKLVNRERFLVYTGFHKGRKITVATHGIGMPSFAIAFEELAMLGAKRIVRLGTAGGLRPELEIGSLLIATAAETKPGGTLWEYFPNMHERIFYPDSKLTSSMYNALKSGNEKVFKGKVLTVNAFYAEGKFLKESNASAVEMECAALFKLARYRKVSAAAVLAISDNPYTKSGMKSSKDLWHSIKYAALKIFETL